MTGGTAAIALPARRVDRVPSERRCTVPGDVDRHHVADAELDGFTAERVDAKRESFPQERRPCVGGEVDEAPVPRPAAAVQDFASQEREPPRDAALRGDDVELRTE